MSSVDYQAIVTAAYRRAFPDEIISEDSDFFELGGDSLTVVSMCAYIEELVGFTLPPSILMYQPTVAELANALPTISQTSPTENSETD
ncbi:enterobactin synthase subunit F [Shimia sp. SK013]|uniref:acyl carrier protein n=1 Tax=Shimia sp. SK013 TaxID=1389006 RepID=UPI0006CCD4FF|nr:acyl carrier protein [Shimia sp. SK013]KPA23245.1 enterobactin synthase subunit F [Shimia sp. SK013]